MNFHSLQCFVKVAELRNFTQAAQVLYTTQPALSRTIAELERECGISLLKRDSRPMCLTAAGELFYDHACKILRQYHQMQMDMQEVRQGTVLRLSVEYGMGGHMPLLARPLAEFRKHYPHVELKVEHQYNHKAIQHLRSRLCDMALINLQEVEGESGLHMETIAKGSLYAFIPCDHPLFYRDSISTSELQGCPLSIFQRWASPIMYDSIVNHLVRNGVSPRFAQEAPDIITFTILVSVYQTIGIMPKHTITLDYDGIRAIPIADTDGYDVMAVWREEAKNPGIFRLCDYLKKRNK